MDIPELLLQHTVTVESYAGSTGYGVDQYETPVEVACFVDQGRRLVRDDRGEQVTSEATIYAPAGTTAPPKSRVTLPDGRTALVIRATARDGGALPVPSHVEITTT